MSTEATVDVDPADKADIMRFVKDEGGRTVFYPNGAAWSGFIVRDAEREQALRDFVKRRTAPMANRRGLVGLLVAPIVAGFYELYASHPVLAFALAFGLIALFALLSWAWRQWTIGRLLDGLEKVDPLDPALAGVLRLSALIIGAMFAGTWLVSYLYTARLAALPATGATITYYDDISGPLLIGLLFALFGFVIIRRWERLAARFSDTRLAFSVSIIAIIGVFNLGSTAWSFFEPEPKIVITDGALQCKSRTPWSEVSDVTIGEGRRGREYVRLKLDAKRGRDSASCEITGLNADYHDVYEAIRAHWQARDARTAEPSPAEAIKQISAGASAEEVEAVLGPPLKMRPVRNEVFFYSDSSTENSTATPGAIRDRRIIAIYFDSHSRVERVASYRLKNGNFYDDFKNAVVTDSAERGTLNFLFSRYSLLMRQRPAAGGSLR